jgi:hypothetical protein
MTYPVAHITQTMNCPPKQVYAFVTDPQNLPRWASGLSKSQIRKVGEDWIADSPMGDVKVAFASANNWGIADHAVTLPDGKTVNNPLRINPNGEGSEVVFTLFQLPGMSEPDYKADAATVAADLERLKSILES